MKLALTALVLIALAASAHAQGGTVSSSCGASPENPTALLALAGSAGATLTALRQRRRKSKGRRPVNTSPGRRPGLQRPDNSKG